MGAEQRVSEVGFISHKKVLVFGSGHHRSLKELLYNNAVKVTDLFMFPSFLQKCSTVIFFSFRSIWTDALTVLLN